MRDSFAICSQIWELGEMFNKVYIVVYAEILPANLRPKTIVYLLLKSLDFWSFNFCQNFVECWDLKILFLVAKKSLLLKKIPD